MATAKFLITYSIVEQIRRNHLQCSICQENYQQPKVLDCQHSFCEQCLVKYRSSQLRNAREIPCPLCKRKTQLPESGIRGLKTNFYIVGLADDLEMQENLASSRDTEQLCELCDEGNEATHRCLVCAKNICANCRRTHLRIKDLSHHTTATIDDIRHRLKCKNHEGEVTRLYCTTCEQLICRDSTVTDHCKAAQCIDYSLAASTYRQSKNCLCSPLDGALKNVLKSEKDVSRIKRELGNTVEGAVAEVRAKAAAIKAQVTAQEKSIIDEIGMLHKDRTEKLDEYEQTLNIMTEGIQYSLETAKDVTSTASDSDFFSSLYPTISKDLTFLASQNPPAVDTRLAFLKFERSQETGDIDLGKLLKEEKWELVREIGKIGSGPVKFNRANGIAGLERDEIAVADLFNKRLVICSTKGCQNSVIPLQAAPRSVASTRTRDRLVVVCYNATDVKVFNKDRTLAFEFPTMPHSEVDETVVDLHSVAVKTDGTIVVGDLTRKVLTEHSPTDGSPIRTIPVQRTPFYIAVDCSDRVVISGWGQAVDVTDGNGATLFTITPTIEGKQVQCCSGVCSGCSGIYVAMRNGVGTGHIHHYDTMGNYICCVAKGLYDPRGITFSGGQQLVVADKYSVKVYHVV